MTHFMLACQPPHFQKVRSYLGLFGTQLPLLLKYSTLMDFEVLPARTRNASSNLVIFIWSSARRMQWPTQFLSKFSIMSRINFAVVGYFDTACIKFTHAVRVFLTNYSTADITAKCTKIQKWREYKTATIVRRSVLSSAYICQNVFSSIYFSIKITFQFFSGLRPQETIGM